MMSQPPRPDVHEVALELFLRMMAADPFRDYKKLAEQAYEAAQAFLDKRRQLGG
jgi:hypothetical protein